VTDPVFTMSPTVAMGTRRLQIVDGAHAIQPQLSFDGRIVVAFNGEIYNHATLRVELEALGVRFGTQSDTEVLANALAVWGPGALPRLNGMFAFVAIDIASGDFLAARDPLGVKPLYLIQSGPGFVFCSEIRPLLEAVETGDVLLLPPGHLLTRERCLQYKRFSLDAAAPKRAHDPKALDALLAAAVHRRLPPGLPVAAMFSGGIDSTLVIHYARQLRPATPGYFLGGPKAPDYSFAARYADRCDGGDGGNLRAQRFAGQLLHRSDLCADAPRRLPGRPLRRGRRRIVRRLCPAGGGLR
jgi:asparagine synthase (glutamine-hydrolysing)